MDEYSYLVIFLSISCLDSLENGMKLPDNYANRGEDIPGNIPLLRLYKPENWH